MTRDFLPLLLLGLAACDPATTTATTTTTAAPALGALAPASSSAAAASAPEPHTAAHARAAAPLPIGPDYADLKARFDAEGASIRVLSLLSPT